MPTHPSHHDLGDDPDGTTRTRLPEGDAALGRRPPRSSPRALVTVVGVVVLLIAALAFATRGGGDGGQSTGTGTAAAGPNGGAATPTAPTGAQPVTGKTAGIASGFPKSEEGAQSAAANYAVALGGDGMFNAARRHQIVDAVYTPSAAEKLKSIQDQAYTSQFLAKLGLDGNGNPPPGMTFVSRTIPVGAKVDKFTVDSAQVSVWYLGLIGMAGNGSTDPVHTSWMTWTFSLNWTGADWKVASDSQKNGPAPVPGDETVASAQDISKAVEQYGGFTYAR